MIWGGARAKAGKKNSTATLPGKKKLNSTTRKKKKVQPLVAEEKKRTQRKFSAQGPPQIINGLSLIALRVPLRSFLPLEGKKLYTQYRGLLSLCNITL